MISASTHSRKKCARAENNMRSLPPCGTHTPAQQQLQSTCCTPHIWCTGARSTPRTSASESLADSDPDGRAVVLALVVGGGGGRAREESEDFVIEVEHLRGQCRFAAHHPRQLPVDLPVGIVVHVAAFRIARAVCAILKDTRRGGLA